MSEETLRRIGALGLRRATPDAASRAAARLLDTVDGTESGAAVGMSPGYYSAEGTEVILEITARSRPALDQLFRARVMVLYRALDAAPETLPPSLLLAVSELRRILKGLGA